MESRHIDEFLREAIDSDCRWLHIISGTIPVMQDHKGLRPFDCERLLSNEVYQIADSFLPELAKKKVLQGAEVLAGHPFSPRYSSRLHVYRQRGTIGISGKLIETRVLSLSECGFPEAVSESWFSRRSGLFLFSGIPDSGRSTTMNSVIQHQAKAHSWHIVQMDDVLEGTFEDFESSLLSRRVYEQDILDFPLTIQSLMKSDASMVAMGELNSISRLEAALRLASRGMFVVGTFLSSDVENCLLKLQQMIAHSREMKFLLPVCLQGIHHQSFFPADSRLSVLREVLTIHPQNRKHLRDGNHQGLTAFLRTGGRKDCFSYSRAFENLLLEGKIAAEEIPSRYRT